MQAFDIKNNLFSSDNFEYVEINKTTQSTTSEQKNIRGIKNAISLLNELENSFKKSNQYEDKLLKCRILHKHCHSNDLWNMEDSDTKDSKNTNSGVKHSNTENFNSPSNLFEVTESWSTMSIVCLQYQYEELSKRYNTLLKAYNDACCALNSCGDELLRLRKKVKETQTEIALMNKTILNIGNKYLTLRQKKLFQKIWCQSKIYSLKKAIHTILVIAERACLEMNEKSTHLAFPPNKINKSYY